MTGDAALSFRGPLVRDHGTAEPRRSGDRAAVPAQAREFLFLDPDIRDPRILLDGLVRPVTIVRLKRHRDPLRQIAVALAGARGIDGLHILCHGAPGALRLAGRMVDTETLRASQDLLTVIRAALSDEAAIGLYACSVCVGEVGATFVDTLSHALGARVEGASEQLGPGAGWQSFDAAFLPFDPRRLESYPHVLVSDTVTGAGFDTTDGTNLTSGSVFADGDDTLYISDPTFISGSTIDGGGGTDTLQLDGGVDISGATVTSFETLLVKNSNPFAAVASATVSAAQHNAFTIGDAGLRPGAAIQQTITLGAGTEAVTGSSVIEAYVLSENYSGTFTLGFASQKVTGSSSDNTFVLSDLSPEQPAKIDGGAGNDTLVLNGTISLVSAAQTGMINNIENLTLGDGASVTMFDSYHDLVNSAPGTNTVSLVVGSSTPVAAHAEVETYVLTDDIGSHAVTLNVQAATNVTSEGHNDTVQVGGLTATGTYVLDSGDKITATDGADISGVNGGAATTAGILSFSGSVTMTVAQHNDLSAANLQGSTGSDTVVLADAGTVTGGATVEAYTLADGGNAFTLGTAGQSVTGGTGADTVNVGTYEVTGSLAGGAGDDTLVMSAGANLSGATVSGFENFALSGNGSFSIPELASGQTIELTGVTGLTAANVRINGSNIEVDTDATDFGAVETTFATGGDLSALGIASVTESGGNTYITLGSANTAPAIGGAAAGQTVDDTATITPFSAVTLADADGDTVSVSIQFDTAGKGAFTAASLTASGFTETSAGVYGLTATDPASAQAAIRQLVFDPAENRVAPGSTETTTFTITVNDGTTTASSATTTVVSTSINDTPSVTSGGTASVAENASGTVYTATGSDPDAGASLTYAISGGADAGLFDIDANTGAITFKTAPDFETPSDSGGNNVYDIEVTASDGTNTSTAQSVAITVTAVDENPAFSSGTTASVAENGTATGYSATAADPEGTAVTYTLTGGADAALFDIDANTGAVTFKSAPDFETPSDSGTDNVYDIQVTATDGTGKTASQSVTITVTAVNETPSVTSGGTASVAENASGTVYTATGSDPDAGASLTYAISGGADSALFDIDANTGAVTFKTAPDFETPADSGANNIYDIEVTASDGTNTSTAQSVAITVTAVDENPAFSSGTTASVAENGTATGYSATAADPEGTAVTYTLTGGADAALFDIDANTGAVTFKSAPDFETPADSGTDNVYDIQVTATDGTGKTASQSVTITVTAVNETPSVTSGGAASVAENATGTVYTVTGSDPDAGASLNYAISGGADAALFDIDANTGAVTFKTAPDFETPTDSGANNVYDIEVTAGDGTNTSTAQSVAVTVTAVNEAPSVTSGGTASVAENATGTVYTATGSDPDAGASLTYAISGGADAGLFDIDANTGAVSFKTAPDFETPTDSGSNNVYDIEVTASDGTNTSTAQSVAITVTNANETPSVTSGGTASVAENVTGTVYTATGSDPDAGASLTYAISGGADAGLFDIDANTGAVTFKTAPDFETPSDSGGNNVYDIEVTASDGTNTSTAQSVAVTVTAVNEAPSVTSGGTASVAENASGTVYTATGSDPDAGASLTYAISGGADAGLFDIDANTGAVTFKTAPGFETPTDSGSNNVYDIEVTASDGTNTSTAQSVALTVTAVNEAPSVTSGATASVAENTTGTVYTATGSDPDAGTSLSYAISGGADAALFDIDATTGAVTFKTAPDFENPTDSGGNNVYDIEVTASDGTNTSPAQAVAVTVADGNEAPTIGNLHGDALTYDRSGKTNRLDTGSDATLSDDSSDFDGGNLTVSIIAGEDASDDVLTFDTTDVSLSDTTAGATVTVGGTVIGTLDNAIAAGNDLAVSFNGDANPGSVQTLLRSIAYQNLDTAGPTPGTRTIQVTVNDGGLDATIDLTATVPSPPSGGSDTPATGIVVTPTTPTTTVGGSTSTSAQVISNRGSAAGSAPVVQNTNNNGNVVTATLPTATSITSEGPSLAQSGEEALTTLINAVDVRNSSAEGELISGARTFLTNLASTTTLDVRTIVPSTTSATLSGPIVITGTSSANGSTQSEAFVIDLRSLPTGSTLQLDNIEFASIMGSATVTGGDGDNFVTGDDNSQFISLGVGDDTLYGGGGGDIIGSGAGKDFLYGDQGADTVFGGLEEDAVHGGADPDVVYGNQQNDVVYGNQGMDTLYGGQDADTLFGGQDRDLAYGNDGQDVLYGNREQDTLYGGDGDDVLYGGEGADSLSGGAGNDTLYGELSSPNGGDGTQIDVLQGGAGDDLFYGGEGVDWIYTGVGADRVVIETSNGFDVIVDFDVAAGDRLLIDSTANGLTLTTAENVLARASDNPDGDTEIDLGGQYVRLIGVRTAELTAEFFELY